MRFLIDAQLPPDLAKWIRAQGHDAWHVVDFQLAVSGDAAVWAKACELQAHLITKDEDFVAIRERATAGPAVLWLRIGNAVNRVLMSWIAKVWPGAIKAIESGATVIEIM